MARPLGRSPFGPANPSIVAALVYATAVFAWIAVGDVLPGGRWLAVHLFTLGVLTNLVLTFSEHFARTLTRAPGERAWWWPLITNTGILLVLIGLPTENRVLVGTGAIVVSAAVFASYRRMRHMRRMAIGARFDWVVRVYERAHGAFLHGAVLGALMGVGLASGAWYGAVRTAHLHANVLGWGGLTVLATLVFFGPSMARTRIEPGADVRSAKALRWGATALTVALLALIVTGAPGVGAVAARLVAAVGLAVFATAVAIVCAPVVRAVVRARPGGSRPLVVAAASWFIAVAWADVVVVATARWAWLDTLGAMALAGVLAQAVMATLTYLAPMLRGRTTQARERLRARLDTAPTVRAVVFNAGVISVAVASAPLTAPEWVTSLGWALLAASMASVALPALWPTGVQVPPSDGGS